MIFGRISLFLGSRRPRIISISSFKIWHLFVEMSKENEVLFTFSTSLSKSIKQYLLLLKYLREKQICNTAEFAIPYLIIMLHELCIQKSLINLKKSIELLIFPGVLNT